ncbi:MAG: hypothetical protein AAGM21_13620 [Pseudomonadota bacterium]
MENTGEAISEYADAFDSELAAKDEKINNLELLLESEKARKSDAAHETPDILPDRLKEEIGPELYEGEFYDRLRSFLELALESPSVERNMRTDEFIRRFVAKTEYTGRSVSLVSQIKSACRDGNQMPKQLGSLLSGFGFEKARDKDHLIYKPPSELFGLATETLPSSPSDSQRGGRNRGSEVIRHFGLNELK